MFYKWYNNLNAHSFIEFMKALIDFLPRGIKYIFIIEMSKTCEDLVTNAEKKKV